MQFDAGLLTRVRRNHSSLSSGKEQRTIPCCKALFDPYTIIDPAMAAQVCMLPISDYIRFVSRIATDIQHNNMCLSLSTACNCSCVNECTLCFVANLKVWGSRNKSNVLFIQVTKLICYAFLLTKKETLLDLCRNKLMCVDHLVSFLLPPHVVLPMSIISILNANQLFLNKPAVQLSSMDLMWFSFLEWQGFAIWSASWLCTL